LPPLAVAISLARSDPKATIGDAIAIALVVEDARTVNIITIDSINAWIAIWKVFFRSAIGINGEGCIVE
jgi:hypothetical protein